MDLCLEEQVLRDTVITCYEIALLAHSFYDSSLFPLLSRAYIVICGMHFAVMFIDYLFFFFIVLTRRMYSAVHMLAIVLILVCAICFVLAI